MKEFKVLNNNLCCGQQDADGWVEILLSAVGIQKDGQVQVNCRT